MQIGLFGGTFNPVHRGHVQVVDEIKTKFALDTVYIIPAAEPPHKKPEDVAAACDRLEMTRRAFAPLAGYEISDVEVNRSGPSYTIDTVRFFKAELPADAHLFWITGLDAFLEFETWKAHDALLRLISLIVMSRPDRDGNATQARQRFETYLTKRISKYYSHIQEDDSYRHPEYQTIYFAQVTALAISATEIRKCIRNHRPVNDNVPADVETYIMEKGLYQ